MKKKTCDIVGTVECIFLISLKYTLYITKDENLEL